MNLQDMLSNVYISTNLFVCSNLSQRYILTLLLEQSAKQSFITIFTVSIFRHSMRIMLNKVKLR